MTATHVQTLGRFDAADFARVIGRIEIECHSLEKMIAEKKAEIADARKKKVEVAAKLAAANEQHETGHNPVVIVGAIIAAVLAVLFLITLGSARP